MEKDVADHNTKSCQLDVVSTKETIDTEDSNDTTKRTWKQSGNDDFNKLY